MSVDISVKTFPVRQAVSIKKRITVPEFGITIKLMRALAVV